VLLLMREAGTDTEASRRTSFQLTAESENSAKEKWQNAKLAADTALANLKALEIKQEGERRAWGLQITQEEDIVITNIRGKLGN
jgi:hypothetical protein